MEIPLDEIGRYIHTDLKTAARSVISIGYWLMYVRDRNQFQEYGYSNINEYAAKQFGFQPVNHQTLYRPVHPVFQGRQQPHTG